MVMITTPPAYPSATQTVIKTTAATVKILRLTVIAVSMPRQVRCDAVGSGLIQATRRRCLIH